MTVRVGRIPYINCFPVYGGIDRGLIPLEGTLTSGFPTELNEQMAAGKLDISVVSAVEYAQNSERYFLLPDLAISCDGPVRSVLLFSKRAASELGGRRVIVSRSSMTSVLLLELLFEHVWHCKPHFAAGDAELTDIARFSDEDHDARLVIGDAALLLSSHTPETEVYPWVYDLGTEWNRWTGQPFVFAVWVAQRTADVRAALDVHASLIASRDWGLAHLDLLAAQAARATGVSAESCLAYLSGLDYRLSYPHLAGLTEFFRRLEASGRVPGSKFAFLPAACHQMRDILDFYQNAPLLELGAEADRIRRELHPEGVVTYIVDRNINYTNVCVADCGFCAFYRRPRHAEGYTLSFEQIGEKIEETKALGGVQILIQGGHNPYIPFDWYLDLLRYIKRNHPIHIHGFSPSEVDFFSTLFRIEPREIIRELKAAGLDSIPGGGGEILVQRVRDIVARKKAGADRWLEIMEMAHEEGMKTSVTMMYGLGETPAERLEHLTRVREVQARTGGFTAFICWPLQPENTPELSHQPKTDAVDYLRTVALSRIVLDNVPNLQSSWVTMGMKIGQLALRFGCNDFGSLMIEENVVSAANTTHSTTTDELERLIVDAGFTPARRRQDYSIILPASHAA